MKKNKKEIVGKHPISKKKRAQEGPRQTVSINLMSDVKEFLNKFNRTYSFSRD